MRRRRPRLPQLLSEWQQGQQGGPIEQEFKHHLRRLAWDAYEQRIRTKGILALPNVYFRCGLLLTDDGDKQGARKEFLAAADDAAKFPFAEWRNEMLVRSHNAVGITAWQEGNFSEAMRWLKMGEEEQTRAGGNWVPDLTANRKRLEGIMGFGPESRQVSLPRYCVYICNCVFSTREVTNKKDAS